MSFRQTIFAAGSRLAVIATAVAACVASVGAQTAAPTPAFIEPAHPAPAPFGALSLFVLGGILLAGMAGAGLVAMRYRRFVPRLFRPAPAKPQSMSEPSFEPPPAARGAASAAPSREKLPPVAATLGPGGDDCDDWFETLTEGPRFGPRIVGLVAAGALDKAEAIATVADHARTRGRDIAVVEAGGDIDPLASALDRRIGRRSRRQDPFGARARIEVVDPADLFAPREGRRARNWKDAFAALAARNDIVLVDLPPVERLAEAGPLLAALDETAVLREASITGPDLSSICAAAREAGARVTHQVVFDSEPSAVS